MPQFICFIEPTRPDMPGDPTPAESKAVADHFAYYQRLLKRNCLILAGRTQEPPHIGIMIFNAPTKDDALSIVAQDPAIAAGVFTCRVQQYQIELPADN